MLCRVAEEIFWMGRYVERTVAVARLIDVTWHLELDDRDAGNPQHAVWVRLVADDAGPHSPSEVRHWMAFDRGNPRSLVSCVQRGRAAARGVRESISSEMWEALNTLHLSLTDPALETMVEDDPHTFYKRVGAEAQYIQGLADCTLPRDEPWLFATLGKDLERADNVANVLSVQAHLLVASTVREAEDTVRWLAVLRSCGSAEAYARYYALRTEPARVVEFLLLNGSYPQSVRFSLHEAAQALAALGGAQGPGGASTAAARSLGLLAAQLEHAAVDEVLEGGLQSYLTALRRDIARVVDHITRVYLRDEPRPTRHVAAARAAVLMAEQQQQALRQRQQ